MQHSSSMTVTDLKNKLLEVVRRVEKGEVFEITKDGEPVAILSPTRAWNQDVTGFARIHVNGGLEAHDAEWTYDVENLGPGGKKRP